MAFEDQTPNRHFRNEETKHRGAEERLHRGRGRHGDSKVEATVWDDLRMEPISYSNFRVS